MANVDDNAASADDVTEEEAGPVRFRHDPRLVLPTFQYHTAEQVLSYVDNIKASTLLVSGGK